MNRSREVKNILNKPWFRRMRGGSQTKLIKEGMSKQDARTNFRKDEDYYYPGGKDKCQDVDQDVEKDCQGRVNEIECVVFVPATPGSKLRDILQRCDDQLSETLDAPAVRFVEKGGTTIERKLIHGRENPFARGRIASIVIIMSLTN